MGSGSQQALVCEILLTSKFTFSAFRCMARGRTRSALRSLGHFLGVIVNGALIVQAVVLLLQPRSEDMVEFCHWLGQGLLFGIVGALGLVVEFLRDCHLLSKGFVKTIAHRTLLGLYYFWLGCCAIGGLRATVTLQESASITHHFLDTIVSLRLVEVAIGYCAWVAAGFNVLTSSCLALEEYDMAAEDEERAPLLDSKAPGIAGDSPQRSPGDSFNSSLLNASGVSLGNATGAFQQGSPDLKQPPHGAWATAGSGMWTNASQAPPGGWSHTGNDKPFGCA